MSEKKGTKGGKESKGGVTKKEKEEEEDRKKQEQQQQELSMIAATFANYELDSKKQTLAQYVDLSTKLREENTKLREEMNERDKDSLQVCKRLPAISPVNYLPLFFVCFL